MMLRTTKSKQYYQGMSRAAREEKRCNLSQTYINKKFTGRSAALRTNVMVHRGGMDLEQRWAKQSCGGSKRQFSTNHYKRKDPMEEFGEEQGLHQEGDHVVIWPVQVPMPVYPPLKPSSVS